MDANEVTQKLSTPLTNGQNLKTAALNHAAGGQASVAQALQLEARRAAALHGSGSGQTSP